MSRFSNHLLHSFPQHDWKAPELLPESDHHVAAAGEDDKFLSFNQPNGFRNSHLYWHTLRQYKASKAAHFTPNNAAGNDFNLGVESKKSSDQKLISVDGLAKPDSTMQVEQQLGDSMNKGSMNFSHFLLRPSMAHRIETTTGDQVLIGNPFESTMLIKSGTGGVNSVTGRKSQKLPPVAAKTLEEPISDVQAKAAVQEDRTGNNGASHDPIHGKFLGFAASAVVKKKPGAKGAAAAPSVCSHESSNHPNHTMKRKYHETHEPAYDSDDAEEGHRSMKRVVPPQGGTGGKRNPNAEMHNLFQRKRRHKISKKMRALQELIPNCDKMDKASLLAKTIEYLKTLELQVQIMSMRSRHLVLPMMLPAPHLTHCCFPMGMGTVTCSPPRFLSIPSISGATALPGITGNHFHMPPMSGFGSPFVTCPGGPTAYPQNTTGLDCL